MYMYIYKYMFRYLYMYIHVIFMHKNVCITNVHHVLLC